MVWKIELLTACCVSAGNNRSPKFEIGLIAMQGFVDFFLPVRLLSASIFVSSAPVWTNHPGRRIYLYAAPSLRDR